MCTIAEMNRRIESISLQDIAGNIVDANIDQVRDMQIKQLMQGLNRDGMPLSPKYSEDPWFKKPGAGLRYAAWKKRLFPETPFDTPNLIVVGVYHNSISVKRSGDSINWSADASFAGSIDQKYADKALGMNKETKHEVWTDIVRSPMIQEISSITGMKIS